MWPTDALTGEQETYSRKLEVNSEDSRFRVMEDFILGWVNISL